MYICNSLLYRYSTHSDDDQVGNKLMLALGYNEYGPFRICVIWGCNSHTFQLRKGETGVSWCFLVLPLDAQLAKALIAL
jgi:hypothetical protein